MDQRMMLAPRMIQSMEILQLPLLALEERIEQEMLSNPMLELEEPEEIPDEPGDEAVTETDAESNSPEQALLIKEDRNHSEDFERLNNLGNDYDDYLSRGEAIRPKGNPDGPDRKLEALHNTAAPTQSLNESLIGQWALVECDEAIRKAGQVIIDFIDDAGYLRVELEELCDHVQPRITLAQMSEATQLVQTLEPTGVGARNLPECLILQLNGKSKDSLLEIEIITHHLKDLEMNRYPAIARKTGKSISEITQAIGVISRLDPRPGLQIGRSETQYITPEIIVEYDHINDKYSTRLTSGTVPKIRINPMYSKMIKTGQISEKAKEYLQNNARSARWLIESIEQRKATVLRVVNHVVQNQREFMEKGSLYLKPM
ncbi:MAG: hypothetical protein IID32_05765, partial [Planctomycetes bacterium]|nr:hypothetical protein [Planctomycetota bacterium]